MTQMTVELLQKTLPKSLQGNATQEWADHINALALDPVLAKEVRENFLTYASVLQEGKYKTEDYLNAVTYVSHKLMGYSNQDAYIKTFPDRYTALVGRGMSSKDISAYVAAYHKNKLVNAILEQSVIPTWLLNQDIYQRAINTQFELMTDPDVSPKVRSDAANSILTHLKAPEVKKVQIDMGIKESSGLGDLMTAMQDLARKQRELIQGGVPARQVARDRLVQPGEEVIEGEIVELMAPPPPPRSAPIPTPLPPPERSEPAPGAMPASAASPAASPEGVGRDATAATTNIFAAPRKPSLFDAVEEPA